MSPFAALVPAGDRCRPANFERRRRRCQRLDRHRRFAVERLENRLVLSAFGGAGNPNEIVDITPTPTQLAEMLVGTGLSVNNVTFTGNAAARGSFTFADPTVVGFGQGVLLTSGGAVDVVGPNASDSTWTDFAGTGDTDLDALATFPTFDAAVLEFDFIPTANQVVFNYTFASDEYPEWVNTPYNDVFAFFVNGTNHAVVRQVGGDPNSPLVPVAVNNINNSNPVQDPPPPPMRPDLFRANYYNPAGPSAVDLELDGITSVLTFQAPVNPGVPNHMKLAIADASDGIYDSAVFIQAGSLVSNENPVADLSLSPTAGAAPLLVTAFIEGEDPNGLPLTYSIDWGDNSHSSGPLDQPPNDSEKTAQVDHTYTAGGTYLVTLTVSNGTLFGTSVEDVHVTGGVVSPIVTNTLDEGPGSLRQAVLDVNDDPGVAHTILFAIAGPGPHAIQLASPLPTLLDPVAFEIGGDTVEIGTYSAYELDGFPDLTKTGDGTLVLGGVGSVGGTALTVEQGTVQLAPGSGIVLAVDALTVGPAAMLDLADNDLIVRATAATRDVVLADVTALVASGANGLAWNGPGIASSAAATDPEYLTALGVLLNDSGLGGPFYSDFDGVAVDVNAVLVKYTYYGDANLSGTVDGTDYALTDNGFNSGLSDWLNGDFNYSLHVDGTDYALIDNAFNSQTGPLAGSAPLGIGPIPRAADVAGGGAAMQAGRDGAVVGIASASGDAFERWAVDGDVLDALLATPLWRRRGR